jgi:predicted KAP-like P-loop ATPase
MQGQQNVMIEENYSSDSPVSKKQEDRFSRWNFSERIAQVISRRSDPSSIVIGLYGVWGDGKTSVLNFIEAALANDDKVICIRFNPWRFGTEDEVLKGFFLKIADALDTKLIKSEDKLKDIVKKILPGAAIAVGYKGVGDSIASFISSPDINEFRTRVENELESQKKRVLIFVDDIDRLEKSEIQTVFKLVKLTADFKYTAYILAFDKDIVAASLQDRYSSASENAGEAFLEKIIHVPLHLPLIEKTVLQNFCFQGIDEALSIAEIELSEQQVQEFVRYFTLAFDEYLSTPRKAKLYSNILLFSLPILKDEVDPVDLMLIEGLRVFCFPLYEVIRKNKNLFTGSFTLNTGSDFRDNQEKEKLRNIIESTIDSNQLSNKEGYIKLLTNLFPKLQAVYGNTYFGNESYDRWDAGQMICSKNYFSRYFTYSIPSDDVSDNSLTQMVNTCIASIDSIQKDQNSLSELVTSSNAETLIRKLRNKASYFTEEESTCLALAISLQCDIYPNSTSLSFWTTPFVQAAMLISDLIQNLAVENRVKLACDCITDASNINFKQEIFRWLRRESEENEKQEQNAFSEAQIQQIGEHLGKNISEYLKQGKDLTLDYPEATPVILSLIEKYLGKTRLNEYFDLVFRKDCSFILRLLEVHTANTWSLGSGSSGLPSKSDFERRQYDAIVEVFGTDKIINAIKIFNDGELPKISGEFPRRYGNEDKSVLLKQFMWIHDYVSTELQNCIEE